MEKEKTIKGFAIHCHHDTLVEYCYDYNERMEYIKNKKAKNEQETRLRLFKILPEKAEKEIPKTWRGADEAWPQKSKDTFHKKWCNCKSWNGQELVFNPPL